jgi:hypothetical protein
LAELRSEVDAADVHLECIVVRPGPTDDDKEDRAELVLAKGSQEEKLLSLIDKLRRVSGVREVNSVLDGKPSSRRAEP